MDGLPQAAGQIGVVLLPVTFEAGDQVLETDRDWAPFGVLYLHGRAVEAEQLPHLLHGQRDGTVDLETGVVGEATGPELRTQALFRDRFIGVVREGHELTQGEITPARYAAGRHISVSRRGFDKGPIDEALKPFGLEREIVTIVAGTASASGVQPALVIEAGAPLGNYEVVFTCVLGGALNEVRVPFTLISGTTPTTLNARTDT